MQLYAHVNAWFVNSIPLLRLSVDTVDALVD
jgi:hypothetical protein